MSELSTSEPTPRRSLKGPAIIVSLVVLVALIAGGSWMFERTGQPAARDEDVGATGYADGTYSSNGNYISPAGPEQVSVTLTLANGVITDAQFQGHAQHPTSRQMQGQFSAGFFEHVVGKNIDELKLTVVNGSSLTPKGFNDAVEKIKEQARS